MKGRELEARGQRLCNSQSDLATVSTCATALPVDWDWTTDRMHEGPQETLTVALVRDSAKTEVEVGEAQAKNVVARSASAVGVALSRSQRQRRAEGYLEYSVGK